MKVLITGSEGSLMQAVIPKLLNKDYEVYGVDNLHKGMASTKANRDYIFYKVNLVDPVQTSEVFYDVKPDYVIQAAAQIYGVGGFNERDADILGQDTTLHNNVLRSAKNNGIKRVVFISSSMVYESCLTYSSLRESLPDNVPAPTTGYGLSKYVNERLCYAYAKQYGIDYTIWRPFNIITPFESAYGHEQGFSHVFADFIERIIVDKVTTLPLIGDGSQIRSFTWIDDVAEAIANYSFVDKSKNEIYNIGNKEPVTMKNLAQLIVDISDEIYYTHTSALKFETVKNYPNDVKVRIPDVLKMFDHFGWKAKKSLRDSIKECIEHTVRKQKW